MNLIDQLGNLKAEQAEIKKQIEAAEAKLLANYGYGSFEGDIFRVTITACDGRNVTDWKGIAEKLGASRQIITANTSQGRPYDTFRVSARNNIEVAA